jgi:hypothetical protein
MARIGGYLLRGSILVAVARVLFNLREGTLYPMSAVSEQAGVMVLLGIALYALTGVPPS